MTLNEYVRNNADVVRKWSERKDTKMILELLQKEVAPCVVRAQEGVDMGHMALQANAIHVGQQSVLNRLNTLQNIGMTASVADYKHDPVVMNLVNSGYTEDEAISIYKERTIK